MAQVFDMRAWHTVLTEMIYWTVTADTPDFAGTESGYTPGDLANISVVRVDVSGEGGVSKLLFTRLTDADVADPGDPGETANTLTASDVDEWPFERITADP